jgi:hypothetical protein
MLARVLNIWIIKQRASGQPDQPHHKHPGDVPSREDSLSRSKHRIVEYLVSLDALTNSKILLRGREDDLQAVISQAWLRSKTHVEGYLEAAAKLIVYLVAAFSGNMTQIGAIIFMGLLLISAGLLALSNAHAKGFKINGRVAAQLPAGGAGGKGKAIEGVRGDPPYPVRRGADGVEEESEKRTSSWPGSSDVSGFTGVDDWAERCQVGGRVAEKHPFDKPYEYT